MATHASTLNSFNMVGPKTWSFTHILTVVLVMCVSAIVASVTKTAQSINLFGGENVSATLHHKSLFVECGLIFESTMPFKSIQNVKTVQMRSCPPPDESYAAEFRTLNVNISAIRDLELSEIKGDTLLKAKHFKDLKLKHLYIEVIQGQVEKKLETSALHFLTKLTNLRLHGIHLPPLSKATNVKYITVKFGTVSSHKLGGCTELRELNLVNTKLENVSPHWLENCLKLKKLRLNNLLEPYEALNHVLEDATNLQELDLSDCKLRTLPWDLLTEAQQLRRLILRTNNLNGIILRNIKMNSVNYLDLRGCRINNLKGLPVSNASQLEVVLSGNLLNDVQLQSEDYDMLEKNKGVSDSLANTETVNSDHQTERLSLWSLPQEMRTKISCPIHLSRMTVKVTGAPIYLNCYDCKHGFLWRAVREKRLIIDARCNEGVKLGDADLKARHRAECETYNCVKASQCQCILSLSSDVRRAHCENTELQTLPQEPGLQQLYAAGNNIHNIYAEDLLDSLQFLDLRNNNISLVNAAAVEKLFSVPERRVLIYGNPIACVCENKELLDALRTNQNRVDAYKSITCVGGKHYGQPISKLDPADLCQTQLPVQQFSSVSGQLGIALVVLTVICLTLLVLYYRYKLIIKVFLYTRGWCLCCVREEELDADRPYDAFVSFSHEDSNTVVEELIPKLENPPCSYKLCVHYRDWVPGELIPKQIKTSVAQSRRTLIVLSRNYVKSIWGLMEFREAHINTLREGRVRVIVIILDDVLEDENLDPELRAYLQANTYVIWGDPWFWDKLKYAMPHRTTERIV